MIHEPKGSKPGPIEETAPTQLTKLSSIPAVDFGIPPPDPAPLAKCASRQTQGAGVQGGCRKSESNERGRGDQDDDDDDDVESQDQQEVTYPEGGFQAWLVVFGSFMGTSVGFGLTNTIGLFHQYLSEHQLKNYSESSIGWIFGIYVFLVFFCGIQIGPIFDAHGPRALLIAGSLCMCVSMLTLGFCTEYWHFMLDFGVLAGIGTSLIFTPAISAVSHWFYEKRGNATGIAAAGGSFGGIIYPLMLQQLFPKIGFAWATRVMGFIFMFSCTVASILIRSRLPSRAGQSVMPDLRIFSDKCYLLLTLGIYFMEWGLFAPITYIASFSISTGALDQAFAYQIVAIFNAGSCLGRWAPGYVADILGRFNSMIATLALCCATTITFWLPACILTPTPGDETNTTVIKALVIVYALLFGFASGSNISLTPVCVGQLCHTSEYGRYYATCYTIVSFGTLTGIPIAGALIQAAGGHYWGVVVWTALCYVVSLACFIWGRGIRVGWKLGVKF